MPSPHDLISDEALTAAVARGGSAQDILESLGLRAYTTTRRWLRRRCLELGLSRPAVTATGRRKAEVTDEEVIKSLEQPSVMLALAELGLPPSTSNYRWFADQCVRLGLEAKRPVYRTPNRYSDDQVFVVDCPLTLTGSQLKRRLIKDHGWADRCMNPSCPNPEPMWAGSMLVMQLDHVNGDRRDNRQENLRLLCPNCHSQTDTFCGRKMVREKAKKRPSEICPECSGPMWKGASRCRPCSILHPTPRTSKRKIVWPDLSDLIEQIEATSVEGTARRLGVSGNAVRKHVRRQERALAS